MTRDEEKALSDFINDEEGKGNAYAQVKNGLFSGNQENMTSDQRDDRMKYVSDEFEDEFGIRLDEALDINEDDLNNFIESRKINISEMKAENQDTLYDEIFEAEQDGINSKWDKGSLFDDLSDEDRDELVNRAKFLYYERIGRYFDSEIHFDPFSTEFQDVIYEAIDRHAGESEEVRAYNKFEDDLDSEIYEKIIASDPEGKYSDAQMKKLLRISHTAIEIGDGIDDAIATAKDIIIEKRKVSEEIFNLREKVSADGYINMDSLSDDEQLYLEVFGETPSLYADDEADAIMDIAQEEANSGMVHSEASREAKGIWVQDRYLEFRGSLKNDIFEDNNLILDNIDTPQKMISTLVSLGRANDVSILLSGKEYCERLVKIKESNNPVSKNKKSLMSRSV